MGGKWLSQNLYNFVTRALKKSIIGTWGDNSDQSGRQLSVAGGYHNGY